MLNQGQATMSMLSRREVIATGNHPRKVGICAHFIQVWLCIFLFLCSLAQDMPFITGNRRSAAGNFEFLNETLREAKLWEIALEERKVKLEEDQFKFECEKWECEQKLHEQQQQQQQQQQGARQYACLQEGPKVIVEPLHYFAADNTDRVFTLGAHKRVLDASEL